MDEFSHPNKWVQQSPQLLQNLEKIDQFPNNVKGSQEAMEIGWKALPQGVFKLNWDAAVDKAQCKVSIGAIVWDWEVQC